MVEFEIKLNDKGYGSFPREVRNSWGRRIALIPNDSAGVVFSKKTPLKDVENSLKILLADVKHRREREERRRAKTQKQNSE